VIGAGIVGASVAYHLARRGAAVTLIDKGQPAGECTGKSFAWIGPAFPSSFLASQPIEDYRRLERELLPSLPVSWSGALVWWDYTAETERFAKERINAGHDVRLIERAEVRRLEPHLRSPPDLAVFASGAGAIEPAETTRVLVRAAHEAGAQVRVDSGPVRLVAGDSRITGVRVGEDLIEADTVVVAAGVGTNLLVEAVGLSFPIQTSPALIVRLRTPSALVNTVVASQAREFRQVSPDLMLSPETDLTHGPQAAAERALAQVKQMLNGAEAVQIDSAEVGLRPIPEDGLPIVGFAPQVEGLYFTVMHSGVYLAPVLGRLAGVEILDDVEVGALYAYRPGRFLTRK
jgi:glycine/D-amino acid oxidase-like deaminating enzyme